MTRGILHRLYTSLCILFIICLALVTAPSVFADERDIDSLAQQLSKALSKAKVKSVVVADFPGPEGTVNPMGKFLADRLSETLTANKKKFDVVGRDLLAKRLPGRNLSSNTFQDQEILRSISDLAQSVITGVITTVLRQLPLK